VGSLLIFKESKTFIQHECIKLIKSVVRINGTPGKYDQNGSKKKNHCLSFSLIKSQKFNVSLK